jgi:hypothetical protein
MAYVQQLGFCGVWAADVHQPCNEVDRSNRPIASKLDENHQWIR